MSTALPTEDPPLDAVELLASMVSIESLSGEESELAEHLVASMTSLGFDAHVDAAGNAVGMRCGPPLADGNANRDVVLLGHMDTVPGHIPVRREGDWLHGRGTVDAKGPLATFVMAVAGVDPAPGTRLVVIGAVEEEAASSKGARHIAETMPAPEVCFIGEPSGWDALTLGYKGRLLVSYTLARPCGHSAGPLAGAPEEGVAFWNGVQALCVEHDEQDASLFDRVLPSLRSLRTDSDGLHDTVSMQVSLRLPPGFDAAVWEQRLRDLAGDADLRVTGLEPAWRSERTSPLARAFVASFRQHGTRPRFKVKTGTSDMNVLGPVWKCPIAAYGPGDASLDHTPEERISLAEYGRAIDVLRSALIAGGWAH